MERKCDDTENVLLLGVQGHLNIWHLPMASYISMQNFNEILKVPSVYSIEKVKT